MVRRRAGRRRAEPADTRRALVVNHGSELYGSDRMLAECVRGLVESGWAVTVSLPTDGPLGDVLRDRGAVVQQLAVPSIGRDLLSPRGLAAFVGGTLRALPRQIRMIRRSHARLVYVNTLTLPSWALAGRLTGRRVACHVHEAERSAGTALQLLLAAPLALSHRLIVNSQNTLDTVSHRLGFLRRRAAIAHNGVTGPAAPLAVRESLGSTLRVLYVGRLSRRKGPHVAVEAIRQLRDSGVDATLTLLGAVFEGYEWYAEELREQIAAAGLGEYVELLGFRPDIWAVMSEHDLLVVPSTTDESFGNTAVEAVLAGRPVICSDIPGLRESAGPFESVSFTPRGDADALAAQIDAVRRDWPLWRDRANAAAADAAARYSPGGYRRRIADIAANI